MNGKLFVKIYQSGSPIELEKLINESVTKYNAEIIDIQFKSAFVGGNRLINTACVVLRELQRSADRG